MSNITPTVNPTNTPVVPPSTLPVKDGEDFIAEAEVMDLSPLKGKTFVVAVSSGDRNKFRLLGSTIHGPYSFPEMCEKVGAMWKEHQHHAKVIVLEKNHEKAVVLLHQNTVDYIEANYGDLAVEAMLAGEFDDLPKKEFTCQAALVEATIDENPLVDQQKQLPASKKEDEEEEL